MRWLVCMVLLAGCLRARATAVHPTEAQSVSGDTGPGPALARQAPQPSGESESSNLASMELGAVFGFDSLDSARVHVAPGVRIFDSQSKNLLWGVAVGYDYVGRGRRTGLALEGSAYVGNAGGNTAIIEQAIDVFAGVTVHSERAATSVAVGPSVGMLAMPGGNSVVMVGLGLRVNTFAGRR
jgi:hypothetical protein